MIWLAMIELVYLSVCLGWLLYKLLMEIWTTLWGFGNLEGPTITFWGIVMQNYRSTLKAFTQISASVECKIEQIYSSAFH